MQIDKIYIQDNFVPDYAADPFRRKVIGVSIIIQEGETKEQAVQEAEAFIKDYIHRNTIDQPSQIQAILAPPPVEEGNYTTHLPKQAVNGRDKQIAALKGDIGTCADPLVLKTYEFFLKTYPELQETYDNKLNQLTQ
jgi:hypothetical protein